jgi:TolB-like protein
MVDFDRGLNKAINRLREALGDQAGSPQFIETLERRGYRFLAKVETDPIPGRIESIAVLPLDNLSSDPNDEYFSDGMTDELIGEIARIGSLRVISRTSIMQYKGRSRKSLPEIARELGVDIVLEGTVAHSGGTVRISAQLIHAHDDRHLWAEKYQRPAADILALQSEVARTIATQIQITLTAQEQKYLTRSRAVQPDAYDAFLKGNFFLHQGIRGTVKSVELFKRAIELDPSQAESYAGLAEALCFAGIFGFRPSAETHTEARVAALRALDLDESNARAHNALADVKKGYDWDLPGAEVEYRRALHLNPSHLLTHVWYAECLSRMDRYDQAFEEAARAIAVDPVSPVSHNLHALILWRSRQYGKAIEASQTVLDLDPSFALAFWWQGLSYAGLGDFPKAIACLTKALSIHGGPLFRALLGHVYGIAGEIGKAKVCLAELTTLSQQKYVSPVDFSIVHAGLGDADSTFFWLEKAYQTRATRVHELRHPYFDRFRSDPRYADLMRRVGLLSGTSAEVPDRG